MLKNQPKIEIKPTATDRKLRFFGWVLVATNFVIVMAAYVRLPDTVPIHFNIKGEADGYGSRSTLLLLPMINLLTYAIMVLVATKVPPWNYNYPTKVTERNAPLLYAMSFRMMAWLNIGVALLFTVISIQVIIKAMDYDGWGIGWLFIPMVVLIITVPLWYTYKMHQLGKA
ncbi:MAG: DUF1648 domain-containing protein [Flavobacteriaceae bacterium]|nr:DUF1648 domain-containing protein [Flavobacteriaceae bacterium]